MWAQRRLRSAWRNIESLATHWALSEDSDQTARMCRLIRVFTGHTYHFVGFVVLRLNLWNKRKLQRVHCGPCWIDCMCMFEGSLTMQYCSHVTWLIHFQLEVTVDSIRESICENKKLRIKLQVNTSDLWPLIYDAPIRLKIKLYLFAIADLPTLLPLLNFFFAFPEHIFLVFLVLAHQSL